MPELKTISETEAFAELEQKAVLVTVNQRLSRDFIRRFHGHQMDRGLRVWETPDILPYGAWISRLHDGLRHAVTAAGPFHMVLSALQEYDLWEAIISGGEGANPLLRIPETARAVSQAWEMCRAYRIPDAALSRTPTEEIRAYQQWARVFAQKCRENGWQDRAGLADAVAAGVADGRLRIPGPILFAGFDEFSPQQMSLIQSLEDRGAPVSVLSETDRGAAPRRCTLPDARAEIQAAARWARELLEENPSRRIGIVSPDITTLLPDLVRIFDDVLHPSRMLTPHQPFRRAWNISLGRPLREYPAVGAALMILSAAVHPLSVAGYGRFLKNPFLGGAEAELSRRAKLDAWLRARGDLEITGKQLRDCAKPGSAAACVLLHGHLDRFLRISDALPGIQSPSAWVRDFPKLLAAMGWPGDRTLDSEAYQALEKWRETLRDFASLDAVRGGLSLASAVARLDRLAGETIFQPESPEAPVQISGMLETAGHSFDHLWIMGMDAETWPPPARPNPFLPINLQKKLGIPHGSPEREFAFADRLTRRLLGAANHVMVSVPARRGDAALIPSPLISILAETEIRPQGEDWRAGMRQTAMFEHLRDHHGPPLEAPGAAPGGTGLLKAQAACPFSAFAGYRLFARPLETPTPGLNARERGGLLHYGLEFFWEKVKTARVLAGLSPAELAAEIRNAVDRAVAETAKTHPRALPQRFRELETERLSALMAAFLSLDLRRPEFSVEGLEKKLECTVAGVRLNTFADRMDRIPDGRLVIVDYKTGEPSPADWFTERMAEPQLPLYSMAVGEAVAAVVFAQVKKGSIRYLGVADAGVGIIGAQEPGGKKTAMEHFSSLSDVIAFWKGKIHVLAEEVRRGVAPVMPVSLAKSCRYCDLKPLCRIGEWKSTLNIEHPASPVEDGNGLF